MLPKRHFPNQRIDADGDAFSSPVRAETRNPSSCKSAPSIETESGPTQTTMTIAHLVAAALSSCVNELASEILRERDLATSAA